MISPLRLFSGVTTITGCAISDHDITFVRLARTSRGLRSLGYEKILLPKGVVVAGRIADHITFVDIVRTLRAEYGIRTVALGVPQDIGCAVDFPAHESDVADSEVLQDKVNTYIQLHQCSVGDRAVCHFDTIPTTAGVQVRGYVYGADIERRYRSAFRSAGIRVDSFTITDHELASQLPADGGLVIGVQDTHTHINPMTHRIAHPTKQVSVGGATLTDAIGKFLRVSDDQARSIYHTYGVLPKHREPELLAQLVTLLHPVIETADTTLRNWRSIDTLTKPEHIYLHGDHASLPGLVSYMQQRLRIPVTLVDPWQGQVWETGVPGIPRDETPTYVPAIAVALGNM